MRKPAGNKLRQAPLASFESFLSLETDTEDIREMRELQWNFNNNNINHHQHHHQHHHRSQQQQTEILERQSVEEPWLSSEFSQLTRKQQNCEIYRVSGARIIKSYFLMRNFILGCGLRSSLNE